MSFLRAQISGRCWSQWRGRRGCQPFSTVSFYCEYGHLVKTTINPPIQNDRRVQCLSLSCSSRTRLERKQNISRLSVSLWRDGYCTSLVWLVFQHLENQRFCFSSYLNETQSFHRRRKQTFLFRNPEFFCNRWTFSLIWRNWTRKCLFWEP